MTERLQASHSAPDLTDLLQARTHRPTPEPCEDGYRDGSPDNDDGRWKARLLTPADSRSPTPEPIPEDVANRHKHNQTFRFASAPPEEYVRFRKDSIHTEDSVDDDSAAIHLRRSDLQIRDSQATSEQEDPDAADGHSPSPDPNTSHAPSVRSTRSGIPLAKTAKVLRHLPASLWEYLLDELRATELDGSHELKTERVSNFFSVPMAVEKVCVRELCEPTMLTSSRLSYLATLCAWTPSYILSRSCRYAS